jgi:hypothetical protein
VTCPVCRATNDAGVTSCRRCKADLTLVAAVETRRAGLLGTAKSALATGDFDAALRHLTAAEAVRGGADVERLKAAAYLLNRDFPAAWRTYQQGQAS